MNAKEIGKEKKSYGAPELIEHGAVEDLTEQPDECTLSQTCDE